MLKGMSTDATLTSLGYPGFNPHFAMEIYQVCLTFTCQQQVNPPPSAQTLDSQETEEQEGEKMTGK